MMTTTDDPDQELWFDSIHVVPLSSWAADGEAARPPPRGGRPVQRGTDGIDSVVARRADLLDPRTRELVLCSPRNRRHGRLAFRLAFRHPGGE